MERRYDAVIVGAGPNGLAAAVVLAEAGQSVLVLEATETIGGGCRTRELTLPGYAHDVCAAIHPMAVVSPILRKWPLKDYGLEWVQSPAALAHPFDDGTAAMLYRSLASTGATLEGDGEAWTSLMQPYLPHADALFDSLLRPVRIPRHPLLMARFASVGLRSCHSVVNTHFKGRNARALFAGCAAHSFLALDAAASASFGLVLALVGHAIDWPCARRGSQQIVNSLADYFRSLGGVIEVGREVKTLGDVPKSKAILFDVPPRALDRIAGDALPAGFRKQLRTFRHGPGVFKMDWALSGAIPWKAAECKSAATVHVGGTYEEIATSEDCAVRGRVSDRPFVLVAQQSLFDDTRAPKGHHTGWAYCHVPNGWTMDMTERIEQQIERFAPGFRDLILARHTMSPADVEQRNANMIGGDICGGGNQFRQLVFRPTRRWNPYTTPNPRLLLCSSSTPPGAGVHGMCGFWAAASALGGILRSSRNGM